MKRPMSPIDAQDRIFEHGPTSGVMSPPETTPMLSKPLPVS